MPPSLPATARHRVLCVGPGQPGGPDLRDALAESVPPVALETLPEDPQEAASWPGPDLAAILVAAGPDDDLQRIRRIVAWAGAVPVVVVGGPHDAEGQDAFRRSGVTELLPGDSPAAVADVIAHLARRSAGACPDPVAAPLPALPVAAPLGYAAMALGALVLAGWWTGVAAITQVVPGLPSMKANTAVMFLLAGTAVVLTAHGLRPRGVSALAATVAGIATATLLEYVLQRSLGLDTLLTADAQATLPGRPAPHTAVAFLLAALVLAGYTSRRPGADRRGAVGALLAFVLVVLLAVLSYLYGDPHLRGVSRVTGMAPHTALGLLMLVVAIPALRPDVPPVSWLRTPGEAGVLLRRLLPAAILAPAVVGGVRLILIGRGTDEAAIGISVFAVTMMAVLAALVVHTVHGVEVAATARERAAAALRESESRARTVSTLAPTGIQEFDADGACVAVNPRWSRISGLVPREAWGSGWLATVHPEDRAGVVAALARTLGGEAELRLDHRVLRPDGTVAWVAAQAAPVTGADGVVIGAITTTVDITASKRAEAERIERDALITGVFDNWPGNAIVYRAGDGGIELLNERSAQTLGLDVAAVRGRSLYELLPPAAAAETRRRDAEVLRNGMPLEYDATLDGRTYRATKFPLPAAEGQSIRLAAIGVDITEHVRAEEARREAEEDFRHAFDQAPTGMAVARLDGHFTKVNDALCQLLGYDREQLLETGLSVITHPEDAASLALELPLLVKGAVGTLEVELRLLAAGGEHLWVALRAGVVRDEGEAPLHLLVQVADITERRRHEKQLQDMADRDPLTGLANRRSFARDLEQQVRMAKRYGGEGALLMLDLDHFKLVNDTLGHSAGDELIICVAGLLRRCLRETDVVARLGGDEFAILLGKADREEAEAVAEKLITTIREDASVLSGLRPRGITASLGITFLSDTAMTGEELLVDADLAMYDAKEAGRDRWAHFASERYAEPRMKARVTWVERIRRALEEDRFRLYAQPILDLDTNRTEQYELLLRLLDEHGDAIPPGVFLYIAERYDLVQEIDRWVAREAIRLLDENPGLVLEVNISGKSLADDELPELVRRELARTGVAPRRLIFEITETAAIANIQLARHFAERMGELGCRFALDDFGAGFGSFYYLKHLPFDYLKIDGEFVQNCRNNRTDQLLIEAVVGIARGLGKETIAEFVTDEETQRFLRRQGVDHAQGFAIGRPAPVEDVLAARRRANGDGERERDEAGRDA